MYDSHIHITISSIYSWVLRSFEYYWATVHWVELLLYYFSTKELGELKTMASFTSSQPTSIINGISPEEQTPLSRYSNHIDGGVAPAICPAILEDHAFIREDLPKAAILTLTAQFVTVVIMRTPYSRVQLRIQVSWLSRTFLGIPIFPLFPYSLILWFLEA